jgi:hypothetical protein
MASQNGLETTVKLLLDRGVDIDKARNGEWRCVLLRYSYDVFLRWSNTFVGGNL